MKARHPALLFFAALSCLSALFAAEATDEPRLISDARMAELESEMSDASADTYLELALACDERRQHSRAAELYQRAAAAGVGVAELRLGLLHETGQGVPQSYAEAHVHYRKAVELGVAEANLRLGMLYLDGWGVNADSDAAVMHIERAAAADYVPAQRVLSGMYYAGVRVPRDLAKALHWADRAAAKHDPDDVVTAALIRQRAAKLPQDIQLAREWYQLTAEQDFTRGMLAMASTFLRPKAKPEEVKLGIRWLELAADGGNTAAAFHLAGIYLLAPIPMTGDRVAMARARLSAAAAGRETKAAEVLEFEKAGQSLATAFRYVLTVPYEERHVQRVSVSPRFAEDGSGNQLARPIKLVAPVYPAALRLTGLEGEATVEFVIDTTGRVRDPKVVQASHPGFSEAALGAVSASRFQPAKRNGSFVATVVRQPVHFRMSHVSTPASRARDRAADFRE